MKKISISLFALSLLLCAGCHDDSGPDGEEALAGAPPGYGLLELALEPAAPMAAGWRVHLAITGTKSVERDWPLDGQLAVREQVFLPQGKYDVHLDVFDQDDQATLSGSAEGLLVLAGQITGQTIRLEPAGSLRIVGELVSGGLSFSPLVMASDLRNADSIAGAQRVVAGANAGDPGRIEYLLLHHVAGLTAQVFTLYAAFQNPANLLDSASRRQLWQKRISFDSSLTSRHFCSNAAGLALDGENIYILCNRGFAPNIADVPYENGSGVTLYQTDFSASTPLIPWGDVLPHDFSDHALVDSDEVAHTVREDMGACALLFDTQANLLCGATAPVAMARCPRNTNPHGQFQTMEPGLYHVYSRWPGAWSSDPIPPRLKPVGGAPGAIDFAVRFPSLRADEMQGASKIWDGRVNALQTFLDGGVLRVWALVYTWHIDCDDDDGGTPSARWALVHTATADRVHWSPPVEVKELARTFVQDEIDTYPLYRAFALYKKSNGYAMIVMRRTYSGSAEYKFFQE